MNWHSINFRVILMVFGVMLAFVYFVPNTFLAYIILFIVITVLIPSYNLIYVKVSPFFRLNRGRLYKRIKPSFLMATTPSQYFIKCVQDDLFQNAIPSSLVLLNDGDKLILETHLLPQNKQERDDLLNSLNIECEPIVPHGFFVYSNQIIALLVWAIKKAKRIEEPIPCLISKQWYRLTLTK